MNHFKDFKVNYYDGSLGGLYGGIANLIASYRYDHGYLRGFVEAKIILNNLNRNQNGNIIESIKIVSHSMGSAYAKGFAQALIDYVAIICRNNPNSLDGLSISEYDFAPFEPEWQESVNGVDTYQYSHTNDWIAGSNPIRGAHYMKTSDSSQKGHTLGDFMGYINSLPTGKYKLIDNRFVKIK